MIIIIVIVIGYIIIILGILSIRGEIVHIGYTGDDELDIQRIGMNGMTR